MFLSKIVAARRIVYASFAEALSYCTPSRNAPEKHEGRTDQGQIGVQAGGSAVPGPIHLYTNSSASSDFVLKSEDEAAEVGRWYGDGAEESRQCHALGCSPLFRYCAARPPCCKC